MRDRHVRLLCLLAPLFACDAAGPGAAESTTAPAAKAEQPATPEPQPAPDSDTAAPEADEPTEPSPPIALTPAQLAPGVDAPSNKVILGLARSRGLQNPAVAAKPVGVGPRAYVSAVRTRQGEPARYALELLYLDIPEAEGSEWSLDEDGHHRLHDWKDEGWSDKPEFIAVTLIAEDLDADGRAEVLARFRYEEMRGGGGLNTSTDMAILNLQPFGEAFRANLHHVVTVFETKGKASFPDHDGDGHPDLLIESRELEEGKQVSQREARWLWDAASDSYLADK